MADDRINRLMQQAKSLPPPDDIDRAWQAISFSYSNLALTSNHRPRRDVFRKLAVERGIAGDDFDRWADGKEWC